MQRTSKSFSSLGLALVLALVVAACGGGGGDAAPAASSQSSSVSSSSSVSVSSTSSASSSSSSSSAASAAPMLSQAGNPIYAELDTYKTLLSTTGDEAAKLAADKAKADIIITWQTAEGGFYKWIGDDKANAYKTAWVSGGKSKSWVGENGRDLGTIDNDATVSELQFLADVYKRSGDTKYRDAARKTLDFLLTMQYPSGGFPQVYPARADTLYSNLVTFNDDAMARVLILLDQAAQQKAPFDGDLFTTEQRAKLANAISKGVDFILEAQIEQNGVKTVWCAQHDPVTYAPAQGRSYEYPSKSGKESVKIVGFLMSQPQTPDVAAGVKAAIAWYKGSGRVADTAYVKRPSGNTDLYYNPIKAQPGSSMWYRFYELDSDTPIFSGRLPMGTPQETACTKPEPFTDCRGKQSDIMQIEAERRFGYEWGGAYGTILTTYSDAVGY